MKQRWLLGVVFAAASGVAGYALGADHTDGTPAVLDQPDASSDITDLFAWTTSDGSKVNLVLDVYPAAMSGSAFSDAVKYVLHTTSAAAYGATGTRQLDVIVTFDKAQTLSLWVVDPATQQVLDYMTGDASQTIGLASQSGHIRAFAGLRDDPFFFNLAGFKNVAKTVARFTPSAVDAAGCPTVDAATSAALVGALQKDCTGSGHPLDFFAHPTAGSNTACPSDNLNQGLSGNILAIVLQVDKQLLTPGGPILAVWASTNK
jgi:hypothetical protein